MSNETAWHIGQLLFGLYVGIHLGWYEYRLRKLEGTIRVKEKP